jgi:NAD-dependent SIR2 family protein deacetylase
MPVTDKSIEEAHEILLQSDALLITAGAGMGVDSGLPDFRGTQGFWRAYPPIARLGISFIEMANPAWFYRDPHLAWAFYGHRMHLYRETLPHIGFTRLMQFGSKLKHGYFVFTSNVDGQFQKAGFGDESIEECHGSINFIQCAMPCCESIWTADGISVSIDNGRFRAIDPLPMCPSCKGIARPNVLMFGDRTWLSSRNDRQRNNFSTWLKKVAEDNGSLVIIECGAGIDVPTVRHNSEVIAARSGARLIRINPRDYNVPQGQIGLAMGALEGITAITNGVV